MSPNYRITKFACFYTYLAMSSIFVLPPILFMTFRSMYGISYTLLGTLVLVNYITQLSIDLIFTFFNRFFNVRATVRIMPLLTSLGLTVYALIPAIFPDHAYVGLVIGTVIFSVAAGLNEVLLSPLIAALPSEHPDRDMSALHSLYAYGVLSVVLISTVFLRLFGAENWMALAIFFAVLPLFSSLLFFLCPIPEMEMGGEKSTLSSKRKWMGMLLCCGCIFLGSAAENTMTNWISTYIESALSIPKAVCDIVGLALFAVLLGLTRTLYAKYGRNIWRVLAVGMAGAIVCYLAVALSPNAVLSVIACVLTGVCTSMLWPGMLIYMEENIPGAGIGAYALMAAGGDFGASVAPQMLGLAVDRVAASPLAADLGARLQLTPEQVGMKVGMFSAAVFPLLGMVLLLILRRFFRKNRRKARGTA